jgi:hypothetical protein
MKDNLLLKVIAKAKLIKKGQNYNLNGITNSKSITNMQESRGPEITMLRALHIKASALNKRNSSETTASQCPMDYFGTGCFPFHQHPGIHQGRLSIK